MSDPGKSRSSSGSSGSSSSSARSEFSLKHRQKTADPTCELCHGTGKYRKQDFRFEQRRCGPCEGTGRVRYTGRVGETRGNQGSVLRVLQRPWSTTNASLLHGHEGLCLQKLRGWENGTVVE
ncbi:hypothetical protein BDZ85DRAFT_33224 [Elsinoe ampelina]|uniref:CR-type domain-containing protein n=1 Tax=Elsinoe ampelina TaxID=302913 RepID=A0A6A6G3A6_9PEZI|nr:hypothetical protein BDZ85DRAFT_33224 [Elsinoe ampelina]